MSEEKNTFESDSDRQDHVRDERPPRYLADQGTSKTSHGDGEPTIDTPLIEARERAIKEEEEKEEAEEREVEQLRGGGAGASRRESGEQRSEQRSQGRRGGRRASQQEEA